MDIFMKKTICNTMINRLLASAILIPHSLFAASELNLSQRINQEYNAEFIQNTRGAYLANLNTANSLFSMSLHDRLGNTQFTDIFTGEKKVTSMWLRQQGGHSRFRDNSNQIKTQGNRYMMQLGGDIAQWSSDPQDRWHLGIMAGYGTQHSNSDSTLNHYRAEGTLQGYSLGSYATWYHNEQDKTGGYLDSWLQYQWFKNSIKGNKLATETYRSKGISASFEVGYTTEIATSIGSLGSINHWYIQPKIQTLWKGVKAHDHQQQDGSLIQAPGKGHAETRIALRTSVKGQHKKDRNTYRVFEPFAELSWIHAYNLNINMGGQASQTAGQDNIAEIKAGVENRLGEELTSWGHVKHQIGNNGYSDSSIMLGMKYHF
jgi:autotransporter family porin